MPLNQFLNDGEKLLLSVSIAQMGSHVSGGRLPDDFVRRRLAPFLSNQVISPNDYSEFKATLRLDDAVFTPLQAKVLYPESSRFPCVLDTNINHFQHNYSS
jgi:hypothetical protein